MTHDLESIIARRFIARRDAKAVQRRDGQYMPVVTRPPGTPKDSSGVPVPWAMSDLTDHLAGQATYGHYFLDAESKTKLFCFDVDLRDADDGIWVDRPDLGTLEDFFYDQETLNAWYECHSARYYVNPRQAWKNRSHPSRPFFKGQLRTICEKFSSAIHHELHIPTACAYTGNKGCHIYGFTGHVAAAEARAAANYIIESFGTFQKTFGNVVWRDSNPDPTWGYSNYTIEVFPKQDTIKESGFGNLCRLPLGRNLKNPSDPCFFIDQRLSHDTLAPHPDPVALLTNGNPWT